MLRRLCRARVLMRLAVVLATTVVVTLLAIWWGPPMPYRVGEIHPHELRARVDFEVINHIELANLEKSLGITKKIPADKAEAVPSPDRPVIEKYPKGMLLVPRGHPIQDRQLDLLVEEHPAFVLSMETDELVKRGLSLFLIFSLLAGLVVMYVARFQTGLAHNLPMIAGVCVLILVTVILGQALNAAPWHAVILPMAMTAMILTLAYNPQFALMISLVVSLTPSMLYCVD